MSNPASKATTRRPSVLVNAYGLLLEIGAPLLELYLRRRTRAGRENSERIGERRGVASVPRPDGFVVWFHAASVGESMSMLRLLDRLLGERRDVSILVTTGTVTSAAMVADRLGDRVIHQYVPVDRKPWVERFLDHWRPDAAIWIESEIWPNLLLAVAARGIPAALVNARMSARSHGRWRRAPGTIRQLLETFDLCLAQTEEEAERLAKLGARDVRYVGHLKYAAEPLPADPVELAELKGAIGNRPLWLFASSHEGEETIAIEAHRRIAAPYPDILTVIVPRHVNRGGAIAAESEAAGCRAALRSAGSPPSPGDAIYVVDSMGELGLWYRLATIACIGGSLAPIGGHNPIEAAQLDCALLYGPHMFSMPGITAELQAAEAVLVIQDATSLALAVTRLIEDRPLALRMAAAARGVADSNRNVIDRVFAALDPLIDRAAERSAKR